MSVRRTTLDAHTAEALHAIVPELIQALCGRGSAGSETAESSATAVDQLLMCWRRATRNGSLILELAPNSVQVGELLACSGSGANSVIPGRLHAQGVSALVLQPGLEADEAQRLLDALSADPTDDTIDFALRLWEADSMHLLLELDEIETRDVMLDVSALATNEVDREKIAAGLREPEYSPAVQAALDVLHGLAHQRLTATELDSVELATAAFTRQLAATGDVSGMIRLLEQSEKMAREESRCRRRVAEATLATARERAVATALLDSLEKEDAVDALRLGRCLALLGPVSAVPYVRWLTTTRHLRAGHATLRVHGRDTEQALVALHSTAERPNRARLRAALLELGTHDALAAAAADYEHLVERERVQIVELGERSGDADIRNAVIRALSDKSGLVRRAALGALRRGDGPQVITRLPELLSAETLQRRTSEEVDLIFEALARIADPEIADWLIEASHGRQLRARFRRPDRLETRCLHALRDMRAPDARAIVQDFRSRAPRAFREQLDQPFDLE
ncbi:MAG: hypothetical protein ACYTGZ_09200 [Planctomycetota bacterium]